VIQYYCFEESNSYILLGLEKCVCSFEDIIMMKTPSNVKMVKKKKSESDFKAMSDLSVDLFRASSLQRMFKECL
jgi:hypothetical protein